MDVTTIARTALGINDYAKLSGKVAPRPENAALEKKPEEKGTEGLAGGAYALDISANGKAAAAKHGEAAEKGKGLSADQVRALQEQQDQSYQLMIETMTEQNAKLQAWQSEGIGLLRFSNGVVLDAYKFALPEVATTPEGAAAAVAEGGAWSVEAVADRIFGMAAALAGDNPDTLQQMQAAVEKGFQQAGIVFEKVTGRKEMPEITGKTHDEITRRFNELYEKLGVKLEPSADEAMR